MPAGVATAVVDSGVTDVPPQAAHVGTMATIMVDARAASRRRTGARPRVLVQTHRPASMPIRACNISPIGLPPGGNIRRVPWGTTSDRAVVDTFTVTLAAPVPFSVTVCGVMVQVAPRKHGYLLDDGGTSNRNSVLFLCNKAHCNGKVKFVLIWVTGYAGSRNKSAGLHLLMLSEYWKLAPASVAAPAVRQENIIPLCTRIVDRAATLTSKAAMEFNANPSREFQPLALAFVA